MSNKPKAANKAVTLSDDLTNLKTFAAIEADTLRAKTEEGKPNPAAHLLPDSLRAVVGMAEKTSKRWKEYAEAIFGAGARVAMFPKGAQYLSANSTPENNMFYQIVGEYMFGKDCLALKTTLEIHGSQQAERTAQRAAIGKRKADVIFYLSQVEEDAKAPALDAADKEASDDKGAATTKRAPRTSKAAQAALDGQVIVLLKEVHEAILEQPHATKVLTSLIKKIEAMLDKAKEVPAKAA